MWRRATRKLTGKPVSSSSLRVDTALAATELAASDAGFALLSRIFTQPYLESVRLVRPFDFEIERSHYLLQPVANQGATPEVLMFRDWLLGIDWSKSQA